MGRKTFDRKFGADAIGSAPPSPGVYLFRDEGGDVLYVGKAVSLQRRLSQYRNASRKKRDRKASTIVRNAASLDWQRTPTERDALLLENELIQQHRPALNVAGAFWFTYPVIAMARDEDHLSVCLTTVPDEVVAAWPSLELRMFGAYRGRRTVADGFFAVTRLMARKGHRERRPVTDRKFPPLRYTTLVRLRRLRHELLWPALNAFWLGRSASLLPMLALGLLELSSARRDAAEVQSDLDDARAFFDGEAARLFELRSRARETRTFVPQHGRDRLRILAQPGGTVGGSGNCT